MTKCHSKNNMFLLKFMSKKWISILLFRSLERTHRAYIYITKRAHKKQREKEFLSNVLSDVGKNDLKKIRFVAHRPHEWEEKQRKFIMLINGLEILLFSLYSRSKFLSVYDGRVCVYVVLSTDVIYALIHIVFALSRT